MELYLEPRGGGVPPCKQSGGAVGIELQPVNGPDIFIQPPSIFQIGEFHPPAPPLFPTVAVDTLTFRWCAAPCWFRV